MSDWYKDLAIEAVEAADIGGELTGAQWMALYREFSTTLREHCIPREAPKAGRHSEGPCPYYTGEGPHAVEGKGKCPECGATDE